MGIGLVVGTEAFHYVIYTNIID